MLEKPPNLTDEFLRIKPMRFLLKNYGSLVSRFTYYSVS